MVNYDLNSHFVCTISNKLFFRLLYFHISYVRVGNFEQTTDISVSKISNMSVSEEKKEMK